MKDERSVYLIYYMFLHSVPRTTVSIFIFIYYKIYKKCTFNIIYLFMYCMYIVYSNKCMLYVELLVLVVVVELLLKVCVRILL